jgi:adenine phosphoribosyltransferase
VPETLLRALRDVPDFPVPGVLFRDVSPLLADPALRARAVDALASPWLDAGITAVVGVESRGFLFGTLLAERLGAGFAMARKPGKLPAATVREAYALEYGSDAIEVHADAFRPGDRVLVHDDVIATGGTAAAAARLVERLGAEVAGFSFLIELAALGGRARLPEGPRLHAVLDL